MAPRSDAMEKKVGLRFFPAKTQPVDGTYTWFSRNKKIYNVSLQDTLINNVVIACFDKNASKNIKQLCIKLTTYESNNIAKETVNKD